MNDITATIDTHLAAYCEPDPARRGGLIAAAWAEGGTLVDPPFDGTGRAGIAALTGQVLAHYPDHRFRRNTAVDAHHGLARYGWELVAPDGSAAVTGTDVVETDDDGRLVRVVRFFGDLEQHQV